MAQKKPPEKPAERKARGCRGSKHPPKEKAASEPENGVEAVEPNKPLSFVLKLDPEHPYGDERGLSAEAIGHFEMGFCDRGMMKGRWCFPIHNPDGDIVAYAGRWVDDDLPEGVTL